MWKTGLQVVSEELTTILLCDLYQRNYHLPLQSLKVPDHPIRHLVDCRMVGEFCQEVCQRKAFGYQHTCGRALEVVTSMRYDHVFPHIKYWDEMHNCKAKWNSEDFVELHKPSEVPSAEACAAVYRGDVCARIEELNLSFSQSLKKYREHGMSWLEISIECLPRGMPKDRVITALVFLIYVGMIQNGGYVYFQKLAEQELQLPVTQKHLEQLRVLSQLLLIQSHKVWRFHESVPY
ncbi:hypothetical protein Q8A67_016768 [Cirrhinus molitorella]|uniref:Uncharacterized protein n=1 Tax=Cirrhinus molitorella TaxID=172907 RepID=A0AA88TIA6_9TELE|nr:hypothetical protein Q8A67_016768 [Cirrhinus molitorella]